MSTEPIQKQKEAWSRLQVEALVVGTRISYLNYVAEIVKVMSSGVDFHEKAFCVFEANYGESGTITTNVREGDKMQFLRPYQPEPAPCCGVAKQS